MSNQELFLSPEKIEFYALKRRRHLDGEEMPGENATTVYPGDLEVMEKHSELVRATEPRPLIDTPINPADVDGISQAGDTPVIQKILTELHTFQQLRKERTLAHELGD
jgi:hypothetical protein